MPDYAKILDCRNRMNPFSRLLHIDTAELREGYAKAVMPVPEALRGPQGVNGILYTIADIAGGNAAASHGEWVVTMCAAFHYLRPALDTTALTAVAREVKYGKRTGVCHVEVSDQNGCLLACGTFTFSRLGRPIEM